MTEATSGALGQTGLFGDTIAEPWASAQGSADAMSSRVQGSMLWAAYGDALGFISELTDRKGLERRTHGKPLDQLMAWRRRVGGRQGIEVGLPPGCWSDATQLRMAVSRSMTGRGFDVETFARIELPVWPSYSLGGGRASKAAAKNLGKPRTLWYANTFPGWVDAGGNGAAMRIQPHVWASKDREDDFLLDVVSDSVCTHGILTRSPLAGICVACRSGRECSPSGSIRTSSLKPQSAKPRGQPAGRVVCWSGLLKQIKEGGEASERSAASRLRCGAGGVSSAGWQVELAARSSRPGQCRARSGPRCHGSHIRARRARCLRPAVRLRPHSLDIGP